MKKALVLVMMACMICVSMSGAAVSVNESVTENTNPINERFVVNQPTESPEVNVQVLETFNQEVDKYLNFGEYIDEGYEQRTEPRDIEYPWHIAANAPGDFVDWIIYVNYQEPGGQEKHFQEEIEINPANFKDRFLEHPWHYEKIMFDTNEDGIDDLDVYYSIFTSQVANHVKGIDCKSIRTCMWVRTEDMLVRDAKLEVWSEIKLNYGLIVEKSRSLEKPTIFNGRFTNILDRIFDNFRERFENRGFTPFRNLWDVIANRLNLIKNEQVEEPGIEVTAADSDWLALGIGVVSPMGERIPGIFRKFLNVGKENLFSPMIFEQELTQSNSYEPLGLLFGFQAGHENSNPSIDVAFEIDFDPAFQIRTQFIPLDGYVYYFYGQDSGCGSHPRITFTTNGFGSLDVELSLIFDSTAPLASTSNWMGFDLKWLGFDYTANKKHSVAVLLTSPSFSGKLKFNGIPSSISCEFDVDLSFTYQQGQLLDAQGTGSLNLNMNSKLDSAILYYPELGSSEPLIEFVKVTGIPASQSLSAHAHLKIQDNVGGGISELYGDGYVDLTMSSSLSRIQLFYRKADPSDPDKLFIDVPNGVPASNRVGVTAKLHMDLDDFSNPANYVYGRIYRDSTQNIQEIDGYLPGESEPIVKITDIPADSEAKAKLEWNKLQGYAYANRQSAGSPDPIEINVDIGTFNIYNYLEIMDGHINCEFHLQDNGYFKFDTGNDMINDELIVTDTSTGNQLIIEVAKVDATLLDVQWDLDLNANPIEVNELAFSGKVQFLEDLYLSATYQGKTMDFDTSWKVGQEGEFSVDFYQDDPVEILIDDLFPNDNTWDMGGGVIISDDFHFDVKWDWKQGEWGDRGEFKINEDTNDPNFDWAGFTITYDPSGSGNPQYGIDVSGTNIGLIVYMEWWKHPDQWLPEVWWYIYVSGNFNIHLMWKGDWYYNVQDL